MRRLVATITAIALTPGCAAIFHGTSEVIRVRSEIPDTTFYAGAQEIGKGSNAVTTVDKKALKKTTLRAEKPNCHPKTTPLLTSFDGVSLLGILLDFGIISMLIVDGAATGAWTRAKQTDYILTPDCAAPSEPAASSASPPALSGVSAPGPFKVPAGLRLGMTLAEVEALQGRPAKQFSFENTTRWDYGDVIVIFEDGRVARFLAPQK